MTPPRWTGAGAAFLAGTALAGEAFAGAGLATFAATGLAAALLAGADFDGAAAEILAAVGMAGTAEAAFRPGAVALVTLAAKSWLEWRQQAEELAAAQSGANDDQIVTVAFRDAG